MASPGWLRWTLAVAMIAVAAYHLSRLAAARRRQGQSRVEVDVELTHTSMGAAMVLMALNALPSAELRGLGLLFAAPVAWFVCRAVHGYALQGPRGADVAVRQVLGCGAMVYMLVVLAGTARTAGAAMTGMAMSGTAMSGAGNSATGALGSSDVRLSVFAAVLVLGGWTVARLRAGSGDAAPVLGLGCQLAVEATTLYMLVAM